MSNLPANTTESPLDRTSPIPNAKPLLPYQAEFIDWLVTRPRRPSKQSQADKLTQLARKSNELPDDDAWTIKDLERLKRRAEYTDYYQAVREGGIPAARRMMKQRYPWVAALHFKALRQADGAGDYETVLRATASHLDRVMPKQSAPAQPTIHINLTMDQAELLSAETPVQDVEYEVLSNDE